jgi:2-methylcitrate dehydratase PrpD
MYQPEGFNLSVISQRLGEEFLGDQMSLKPYPCGRPTHSYIDAAIKLHHELELHRNAMRSVVVRTDPETYSSRYNVSSGIVRPQQQVEAQFSLPYLIACGLVLGEVGIDQITSFGKPPVLVASSQIRSESKEGMPKGWAEIEVVCAVGKSGTVELEPPSGSPDNPLSTDQLREKFRDCAAHALQPPSGESVDKMIYLILEPGAMADSRDLIKLSTFRAG